MLDIDIAIAVANAIANAIDVVIAITNAILLLIAKKIGFQVIYLPITVHAYYTYRIIIVFEKLVVARFSGSY